MNDPAIPAAERYVVESHNDDPADFGVLALGPGRRRWDHLELLERIDAAGSISAAANAMGMSYKAAWQAVEAMNNQSEQPLVARQTGGKHGGGTSLTDYGRRVVGAYRRLEKEHARVRAQLSKVMTDFEQYYQLIRRFDMQTSARNQFLGKVKSIKSGPVNAEVILDLGGGDEIAAIITQDSVEHLGLKVGQEAYALIKAPWVILTTDSGLKTSARNHLCGTVVRCQPGAVNAEVIIELAGGKTVAAIVTQASIDSMGFAEGVRCCALIKASHVILAVAN
jgi:molybdate transport system regulatory protein